MTPLEFLGLLLSAGYDVGLDHRGIYCRSQNTIPDDIKEQWRNHKKTLEEMLTKVDASGVKLIWSSHLKNLIAIIPTPQAAFAVPAGVVCYQPNEIKELSAVTPQELKEIHTAKRLFNGMVVQKGGA